MAFADSRRFAAAWLARGILVAGVAALGCDHSYAQASGVTAVVAKAVNGCFASAVRFTGVVVPRVEAIVNFNADGYAISEILVREGTIVTAGQVLAKLTRLSGPGGQGSPGQGGGGQGQAAQGQSAQGQSGQAAAQQPATLSVTAPVGGLVSKSSAKIGAVAAPVPLPPPMGPEPLFRIIAGDVLEVEADVPSVDLPKLKSGEQARIRLDNSHDLSSQVRIVLPEIDRNTQLGKVRLTVDSDPSIRAGMFARGTIDASHSCGVSIPHSAVQYQTEGTTVQVVQGTTVETRRVRLGLFSDSDIEVLDGVKEGELVIANAGTSLHNGDRVKPIFADEVGQLGAQ